jgi:hypothetical protein
MANIQILRDGHGPTEDPSLYPQRLGQLAEILAGIPWMLAGGLAIPVTLGRFYRRHYDVDVVFPLSEFPRVDHAMRTAGYALTTYRPMSFFGKMRFAVSVPVKYDGLFVRRRPRKLKYRDVTGARRAPNLLSVVEALPYRIEDGCFQSCDGRYRFPLVRPLEGYRVHTPQGHAIPCLNLHYVGEIKRRIDEPKHTLDLAIISGQREPT